MKHITFASDNMSISAQKCAESCPYPSKIYTPDDIDPVFAEKNRRVLSQKRGAGYWLWKPYFVHKALQDTELLIYTDAGVLFLEDPRLLVDQMRDDIMVFGNRWRHGDWCKMDVLIEMDCTQYADSEQLQASCIIMRRSDESLQFAEDWLRWSQIEGMIDDSPSVEPNPPGWREHRHDQAILTNLAFKYKLHFHWWPAVYNVRHRHNYTETYPVIFQHHRKRNEEW